MLVDSDNFFCKSEIRRIFRLIYVGFEFTVVFGKSSFINPHPNPTELKYKNPTDSAFSWLHHIPTLTLTFWPRGWFPLSVASAPSYLQCFDSDGVGDRKGIQPLTTAPFFPKVLSNKCRKKINGASFKMDAKMVCVHVLYLLKVFNCFEIKSLFFNKF